MKPMSKKTNEEIYIEWLNEWLTTERMAENYNMDKNKLEKIIEQGRREHLKKIETKEYLKFWGIA